VRPLLNHFCSPLDLLHLSPSPVERLATVEFPTSTLRLIRERKQSPFPDKKVRPPRLCAFRSPNASALRWCRAINGSHQRSSVHPPRHHLLILGHWPRPTPSPHVRRGINERLDQRIGSKTVLSLWDPPQQGFLRVTLPESFAE